MRQGSLLGRSILLALTALSACAATTPPAANGAGPVGRGAYGDYLIGQYAASRMDFPQAATSMRQALRQDPSAGNLVGEAFMLELLAGNHGTASALATAVPTDPLAQLLLAGSAAKAGRWRDALRRYQAMPTPDGLSRVMKPLLVAWAQRGAGQTDAAIAGLQQAMGQPALRGIYALHLALVADQANRIAIAAQNYGLVQGSISAMNLRLAQVLASWDQRSGDKLGAQRVLDQLSGDLAMAMVVPAVEARLATPPVRNATDGLAEAYVNLAGALQDQQQMQPPPKPIQLRNQQTTMVLLQLALQLRPDLTQARLLLADVTDNGHNAAVALAALAPVPATDPLYPLVAIRRAILDTRLGQEDQAKQILADLAQRYPVSAEPYLALGDLERGNQEYLAATDAYSKALKRLVPGNPALWLVYYDRGMSYDLGGDWAKAEADLKMALTIAPNQPFVLNYLGYSWAVRGQNLAQAQKMIQQALQVTPNDGAVVDSLGYVLLRRGDAKGAVAALTRAVQLAPEDPTINAHLGDALQAAGQHVQATFQWRRALQLGPDDKLTAELIDKLKTRTAEAPVVPTPVNVPTTGATAPAATAAKPEAPVAPATTKPAAPATLPPAVTPPAGTSPTLSPATPPAEVKKPATP